MNPVIQFNKRLRLFSLLILIVLFVISCDFGGSDIENKLPHIKVEIEPIDYEGVPYKKDELSLLAPKQWRKLSGDYYSYGQVSRYVYFDMAAAEASFWGLRIFYKNKSTEKQIPDIDTFIQKFEQDIWKSQERSVEHSTIEYTPYIGRQLKIETFLFVKSEDNLQVFMLDQPTARIFVVFMTHKDDQIDIRPYVKPILDSITVNQLPELEK